ncbi:MAG: hypothetical protein K6E50_09410 [Lachnospiraceae bacterium]|nr:hypothetical protein [Lachnospiraceae bacterium]
MVDVNQIMFDLIRKSNSVPTSRVNEIEEVVDTGLEKTEDNVQKIAIEYLEEKGYAKSVQNMDMAKKHVNESSAYYDTVHVRRTRRMEQDLLSEAEPEDLEKLKDVCLLDNLIKVNSRLESLAMRRYEYAVEVVDEIQLDSEKSGGTLVEFVSFQTLLNRYAAQGFHVVTVTTREVPNGGKLMMAGFSSTKKQTVVVFERAVES